MKANRLLFIVILLISPLCAFCALEGQNAQEGIDDKISLDLKNVDLIELLRIISLKTGKTIVPSKDVAGRITIYLNNVAFNDVLDIILLTQGLALNRKDNIYYVMSEVEYRKDFGRDYVDQRKIQTVRLVYAKPSVIFTALGQLKSDVGKIVVDESSGTIILIDIPEKLELLNEAIKELDRPLTTTVYDLNYIKAADAKTQLGAAVTQGTGEVIIDERSGKAIISDLPQKMQKMTMLVRELDEASRQVYVEADIVELTLSDKLERGIDWEKVYSSGAMDGLALAGFFPATLTAAYQKISVGTLATDKYKAILNFLNTYGKTNIISQPRIAVVNNEEANVMVGAREAYITQTQSQATSTTVTSETVEFIDVGVKLKIVPRIGADGFITMKLKPEVSSVKETITTALGSRIPIVQTSQSETVVKIKDGMMIMIAGMTKVEDTDSIKGWPLLSKIPFLGTFFSYRAKEKKRTEVIIFLTPHLSQGDVGLRGAQITKILPMEYLPENLQDKVSRDKKIDSTLVSAIERSEIAPYQEKALQEQEVKLDKQAAVESAAKAKALAAEKTSGAALKQESKLERQAVVESALKAKAAEKTAAEALKKEAKLNKQAAAESAAKAKAPAAEKTSGGALKETAKDYYRKGLRAQADSDPKEAIRNFIRATELDNKYAAAYNSLGIIYEQEFKSGKAEEMYIKAIAIDPNFSASYSNLALLNEERQDFTRALEYWRKRALLGEPNDPWTMQALKRVKELEKLE